MNYIFVPTELNIGSYSNTYKILKTVLLYEHKYVTAWINICYYMNKIQYKHEKKMENKIRNTYLSL